MIIVKRQKKAACYAIEVRGHAGYADKGKDIVCSAVSALFFNNINLLKKLGYEIENEKKDDIPLLKLKVKNCDHTADVILDNLYHAFQDIACAYPQNIKVNQED